MLCDAAGLLRVHTETHSLAHSLPSPASSVAHRALAGGGVDVAVACWDARIYLFRNLDIQESQSGELQLPQPEVLHSHSARVWSVRYSNSKSFLASSSFDNRIVLHDASTLSITRVLSAPDATPRDIAFTCDDARLVVSTASPVVLMWDIASNTVLHTFQHELWAWTTTASPSAPLAVTGSEDLSIKVWDSRTGWSCIFL